QTFYYLLEGRSPYQNAIVLPNGYKFDISTLTWERLPPWCREPPDCENGFTVQIDDCLWIINPSLEVYILKMRTWKWIKHKIEIVKKMNHVDYAFVFGKKLYIFGCNLNSKEIVFCEYDTCEMSAVVLDCTQIPYFELGIKVLHCNH